ncbi:MULTISPECIES: glycine zipper 2TM domain-containing protein [Corallincola]|uniref:glycine zipper 2TM domain-containing protein n=1 Tax=Corallincola TaxID=1775176 RepID=UPI0018F221DE|nr:MULTISPECIES: glycine zipper 2TM domain-containing protein [Corallincola]
MRKILIVGMATLVTFLAGCAPSSQTGTSYNREEARKVQQVRVGQVLDVQVVNIEGTKSGAGGLAGAAVGGIAGSSVGGGKGSDIAAVVGAVVGATVGAMAEESLTAKQGHEYTIRLESGDIISVVQAFDPEKPDAVASGDWVKILQQGSSTRVNKLENYSNFKADGSGGGGTAGGSTGGGTPTTGDDAGGGDIGGSNQDANSSTTEKASNNG